MQNNNNNHFQGSNKLRKDLKRWEEKKVKRKKGLEPCGPWGLVEGEQLGEKRKQNHRQGCHKLTGRNWNQEKH